MRASVIILARDLADCRVHQMDALAGQASHRVVCVFVSILGDPALNVLARHGAAIEMRAYLSALKKSGGRDRNRKVVKTAASRVCRKMKTQAILTGPH